ncbi:MAG: response regulator, partial [Sulfurovaceae bacterium]|nr:response regulator [Sulfurovaceae bacterium]
MNNDLMKIVEETKKLKAMVLEDDQETNDLMSKTLDNFFANVQSALDGESALELYEKHQPDIIFIDIILPGKSGLDIAKEIRDINPKQMIVIVSASDDMGNIS